MSEEQKEAAIVPTVVEPLITAEEAKVRMERIQKLKLSLLDESDYQEFRTKEGPKKFVKKSGWRKLAGPFGISDEIVKEYKEEVVKKKEYSRCVCGFRTEDPKDINPHMQIPHKEAVSWTVETVDEPVTIWRIHVKATYPNGRSVVGIGAASSDERDYAHEEHDLYSLAHTRSKNRAISDLIGLGEVSAEEISGKAMSHTKSPHPQPEATTTTATKPELERECSYCHEYVDRKDEWYSQGELVHKDCVRKRATAEQGK